jgi:hypothetical protein
MENPKTIPHPVSLFSFEREDEIRKKIFGEIYVVKFFHRWYWCLHGEMKRIMVKAKSIEEVIDVLAFQRDIVIMMYPKPYFDVEKFLDDIGKDQSKLVDFKNSLREKINLGLMKVIPLLEDMEMI